MCCVKIVPVFRVLKKMSTPDFMLKVHKLVKFEVLERNTSFPPCIFLCNLVMYDTETFGTYPIPNNYRASNADTVTLT